MATGLGGRGSGGLRAPCLCPSAGTIRGLLRRGRFKTQLLPLLPDSCRAHPAGDVSPWGQSPRHWGQQALKSQGTRQCLHGRGSSALGAFASKGICQWMAGPRMALGRNAHPPRPIWREPRLPLPGRQSCVPRGQGGGSVCFSSTGNRHPSDTSRKAHWNSDLKAENPQRGGG